MSTFLVQREIQAGELIALEIETKNPNYALAETHLITRAGRPLSAAAAELLKRTAENISIF
jgi:hypothetical protein